MQLAFAGRSPAARLMVLPPALAITVPPLQLPTTLGTAATSIPAGSVSLTAIPVMSVPRFELEMVRLRVDVPPTIIGLGAMDWSILGGATTTTVALPVPPVPPFVELAGPVVLAYSEPRAAGAS